MSTKMSSEFTRFILKLSNMLDEQDVSKIKLVIQLNCEGFAEDEEFSHLKFPSDLLRYLWKRNYFSKEDLHPLIDLLDTIEQYDKVRLIHQHTGQAI